MNSVLAKFILIFGVTTLLSACANSYTKEEIENLFEPITSKYGIKIVYEIGKEFLSPVETIGPPPGPAKDSKVKRIDDSVLIRYPRLLQKAMEKYPVQVIKNHLNAIHFAKDIDQGGFHYGGSYDPYGRVIYLVNKGHQSDDLSIAIFHHEFSSLLLKGNGFLLNPWTDQNTEGFKYLTEIRKSWNEIKTTGDGKPSDYEMGFVTDYGRTSFENDFNEYSAMIFTHPQKFKKIMNQYPRVRGKFLVWLAFYHEIVPIFTEAYLLGKG
jgi:hypothetical protein